VEKGTRRCWRSSSFLEGTRSAGLVLPDTGFAITTSCGKVTAGGADGDADDRVLVALELHVGDGGTRIPELDTAILASRDEPVAVGREGDTEDKVAVTSKGRAAPRSGTVSIQIPETQCLVE